MSIFDEKEPKEKNRRKWMRKKLSGNNAREIYRNNIISKARTSSLNFQQNE